jgi:hypothetical protein
MRDDVYGDDRLAAWAAFPLCSASHQSWQGNFMVNFLSKLKQAVKHIFLAKRQISGDQRDARRALNQSAWQTTW